MRNHFNIESFLPYRLNRAAERLSGHFMRQCDVGGEVSWTEWQVLWSLGEGLHGTAKAISGHAGLTKTKVSRAVKALEDRSWLGRQRDTVDRRFEILTLTDSGQAAYTELKRCAADYQHWLEGAVDLPYLKALDDGLSGIEDAMATGHLRMPSPADEDGGQ